MAGMPLSASNAQALLQLLPPAPVRKGDAPRVLIPSPLQLTQDQELNLCTKALAHDERLSIQLGRANPNDANWLPGLQRHVLQNNNESLPLYSQIALNHMMRQGRVEWRKTLIGGLFAESNHHMPLIGRFVDQQVARACDNFFGTDPWFTATPVSAQDDKGSEQITQWTRHEASEAELDATLRESIDLTFTQGFQPVKLEKVQKLDFYKTSKMVAVDNDGTPLVAQDGDYIYQQDQWIPQAPPVDPTQHNPDEHALLPAVGMVLKRDGQTPKPAVLNFQLCSLTRVNTRFDGPRATNVFYMDFLVDLTEPDIQEAPVVIEVTTVPLISFIHHLLTNEAWNDNMPSPETRMAVISDLLHNFASTSNTGPTHASAVGKQPLMQNGETAQAGLSNTKQEPDLDILVVWMHDDVNNDGITESVVLLMTQDGRPLYYDYVANMTFDGLRPYEILRINPVAGRWWGIGEVQKFLPLQALADLLFNRLLWMQSQAGNLIFWDPSKVLEGENNPNLKINGGTTYRLRSGARAEEACAIVPIHDIKGDDIMKALELVFQAANNRSGVSTPNDARAAGLDTAELATGVKQIEQSGQELFGKFLSDLTRPIRRIVKRFLGLVVFHIDGPRTFVFFEGDNASIITLAAEDLRGLELHVVIDLSRYSGQQRLAQATAAADVLDRFLKYQGNPQLLALVQPIYLELAKASGMKNADHVFPTPEQLQGLAPPAQPPGPPLPPPPKTPDPNAEPVAI